MFSIRSPRWLVVMLGLLIAQAACATPTFFSQFGQDRTHHIDVERLTGFNLTIVGVPQYLVTEWYLDDEVIKSDSAGSPSNRTLAIGGFDSDRMIDAVSYDPDNPGNGAENHIWHVSVYIPDVPQPDLVMEIMQVWPSTVGVGDTLNFSWRVCNQGEASAMATEVHTYISGDSQGSSEIKFIGFMSVPGLSVGNCSVASNSSWTVTELGPGTRWLALHVNANEAIPEPNYANNIDTHSFNFVERVGSLRVTINPAAAVAAGAQWRLGSGSWQNSGSTLHDIPIGTHTISFRSVSGWSRPGNQQVVIQENQLAQLSATYIEQVGSLQVALQPSGAVSAGARWRIRDFSGWMESGSRLDAIPIGNYVVEFSDVAGFFTPANRHVKISDGSLSSTSGVYQPASSIQVTLTPQAAVDGGALWRLAGAQSWLPSGGTISGIDAGSHTIEFHPAVGFLTPANRVISVAEGMLKTVEQGYEVISGHPLDTDEKFSAEINVAMTWAQDLLAFASTPEGSGHEFGCRLSTKSESTECVDAAEILVSERMWQFMRLQRHPWFDDRGEGCYAGWFGCAQTNRDAYFEAVEDIQHALLMIAPQVGRFVRAWRLPEGPRSQAFIDGSREVTYQFASNVLPSSGLVACMWPENVVISNPDISISIFTESQLNLALAASSLYQAFNSRSERLDSLNALRVQLGSSDFEATVKAAIAEELASTVMVPEALRDYSGWWPGTLYNDGFEFQEDLVAQAARLDAVLSEMEKLLSAALPSLEGLLISFLPFSFLFDLAIPLQMEAKIASALEAFRDFADNPMGFNDDCGARETHWQTMVAGWQQINLSDFSNLIDDLEFDCQGQSCLFHISPESHGFLNSLKAMIAAPPEVDSLTVSDVTANQARVRVQVQSQGLPLQAYFQYRAAGGPFLFSPLVTIPANGNSAQLTLTELACGTDYEVRAYVSHGGGEAPSETVNFTTLGCPEFLPPAVQTQAASSISQSSANLGAKVHPNGAATSLQFRYGSSQFQMTENASYGSVGSGYAWSGDLSMPIDDLACGTDYYFQAMAESVHGQGVGAIEQFSTQACPPGVPAAAIIGTQVQSLTQVRVIADVHHNNASTSVEIQLSHDGGSFVSHGSYAGSPISSSEVEPYRINANLAGLECGASYAVRLRLVNSAGTVTTSSRSFQMPACPRTLTVVSQGAANVPIDATPTGAAGITNYEVNLQQGSNVELVAPAAIDAAQFSFWTGCDAVGGDVGEICVLEIVSDRLVSASYAKVPGVPGALQYQKYSGSGDVHVAWGEATDASTYQLELYKEASDDWTLAYSGEMTEATLSLDEGSYVFRVQAVSGALYSDWRYGDHDLLISFPPTDSMFHDAFSNSEAASHEVWDFQYIGAESIFIPPQSGWYMIELWGGAGGNRNDGSVAGPGGYTRATAWLDNDQLIRVYVGGQGQSAKDGGAGGWNGGGSALSDDNVSWAAGGGGGGTDIRIGGDSFHDRILVAGGGAGRGRSRGGTPGGGLHGGPGGQLDGNQVRAGSGTGGAGGFGFGANSNNRVNPAAGGGWFGGGVVTTNDNRAGGGSGFVSQNSQFKFVDVITASSESGFAHGPGHARFSLVTAPDTVFSLTVSKSGQVDDGTHLKCMINGQWESFCTNRFFEGQSVQVAASPGPESTFLYWTGACAGSGPVCPLEVVSDLETVAVFEPASELVDVTFNGAQAGDLVLIETDLLTITWETVQVTHCNALGDIEGDWSGSLDANGSVEIQPWPGEYSLGLRCWGSNGEVFQRGPFSIVVEPWGPVGKPEFKVNGLTSPAIHPGQGLLLQWHSAGAFHCSISSSVDELDLSDLPAQGELLIRDTFEFPIGVAGLSLECFNSAGWSESALVGLEVSVDTTCADSISLEAASGGQIERSASLYHSGDNQALEYRDAFGAYFPEDNFFYMAAEADSYVSMRFTTPFFSLDPADGFLAFRSESGEPFSPAIISISRCEGQFNASLLGDGCAVELQDNFMTGLGWSSQPGGGCHLDSNTEYFLNILFTPDSMDTPMQDMTWGCNSSGRCKLMSLPW